MKFKELPKNEGTGAGLPFLKLTDGQTVTGVLAGDLYDFYQIWEGKQIVPQGTKGASFRFRVNVITKEGTSYVAKVWEQGATIYNKLKDLNAIISKMSKGEQDLRNTVIEITRHGSGKDDTEYEITIADQQPTDAAWKVIFQTPLNKLEHKAMASKEPNFDQAPMPDSHDELPF